MPRKAVLTEEERRQHQREAMQRWREKQKSKPKPQKSLFPPSESVTLEPLPGEADPAIIAAYLNEKHGFSVVVGEYRQGKRVIIAERLRHSDLDAPCYRLKVTQYYFFHSMGELHNYALKNKIPLETNRRKE